MSYGRMISRRKTTGLQNIKDNLPISPFYRKRQKEETVSDILTNFGTAIKSKAVFQSCQLDELLRADLVTLQKHRIQQEGKSTEIAINMGLPVYPCEGYSKNVAHFFLPNHAKY